VADEPYIRSVNVRTASWFRGAQDHHEARIRAGGSDEDVLLVQTEETNDGIDTAYRTKYHRYADSYVTHMVHPEARATTIELLSR
jgi:hypothetical protein